MFVSHTFDCLTQITLTSKSHIYDFLLQKDDWYLKISTF